MTERSLRRSLSDMQGRLFELSGAGGWDSARFVETFMNSRIAKGLDSDFDFMQWAGKEYILERMMEECPDGFVRGGVVFDGEALFWMGYLYRYWHFRTGESSREIYRRADAQTMNSCYLGFHTLDADAAIDRLRGTEDNSLSAEGRLHPIGPSSANRA